MQHFFRFCTVAIVPSCSRDDDDLQLTRLNGKPSCIAYENDNNRAENVYFYYQGDKLSEIKEIKGSILKVRSGDLITKITNWCLSTPLPKIKK
jgi:hypothetical protein